MPEKNEGSRNTGGTQGATSVGDDPGMSRAALAPEGEQSGGSSQGGGTPSGNVQEQGRADQATTESQ